MSAAGLGEILSLLMFLGACFVLLLGFPVAFSLAGTAVMFAGIGMLLDVFQFNLFGALASRYFGVMVNEAITLPIDLEACSYWSGGLSSFRLL